MQSCRQSVNQQENIVCWKIRCCRKVGNETQRRIYSFRFFLPPPMTIWRKKQVMYTQQQPSRHRQRDSRKKQILSPNSTTDHRQSRKNQSPNQDGHILGLSVSAHQAMSFRFSKRQLWKSKPVFRSLQVASFDSWRWLHYGADEDKVICHTYARVYTTQQLAMLMLDPAIISKGYTNWKDATRKKAIFFATWNIPLSPGSCIEKHQRPRMPPTSTFHHRAKRITLTIEKLYSEKLV